MMSAYRLRLFLPSLLFLLLASCTTDESPSQATFERERSLMLQRVDSLQRLAERRMEQIQLQDTTGHAGLANQRADLQVLQNRLATERDVLEVAQRQQWHVLRDSMDQALLQLERTLTNQ